MTPKKRLKHGVWGGAPARGHGGGGGPISQNFCICFDFIKNRKYQIDSVNILNALGVLNMLLINNKV